MIVKHEYMLHFFVYALDGTVAQQSRKYIHEAALGPALVDCKQGGVTLGVASVTLTQP